MTTVASRSKNKTFGSAAKGRTRKSFQVDTNISSYDRTDPFLAFNVLRKLLGALPSRIGGCQYKLSPEEHRLSMHLLTIVEPFVGLAPSRRTLMRQPNEILDSIVFHIDSKRDLLALALSCRRLHGVIFPRHYDYRVIRCKVSSMSVWNHLVAHRSLARNVRRLEILDERGTECEAIPMGILTSDSDLESTDDELSMHAKQERFLVSAVNRMTALQSVVWSCNHSPISIDTLWPTLLKCQSLQEVEINDNLVFGAYAQNTDTGVSADRPHRPSKLRNLKTVALRSTRHVYGATKTPNLLRVSNMLGNCPNLESLDIGYNHRRGAGYLHPKADDLFLCSRWPQLRFLSLTNICCSPVHGLDTAATFLCAHLNIEVLHLDMGECGHGGRPQFVLPSGSLPKLKELRANNSITASIVSCPSALTSPRPLETLKGIRLTGGVWDQPLLQSLRIGGGTVKRVEMVGWSDIDDIKKLADRVPKISWLDIGKKLGVAACGTSREIIPSTSNSVKTANNTINTNVVDWANALSILPDLTTFHGIKFFYEVSSLALASTASSTMHSPACSSRLPASELSRVRKNENIASVLASKCPKLRRCDCWDDIAGKVIVFVREGGAVRLEVRKVKI